MVRLLRGQGGGEATAQPGVRGFATFQYPNLGRAATTWYHDHALGMTRLNVYAGPAGFFIIRGGPAGDAAVLDSRTGLTASLPGPAPRGGRQVPAEQAVQGDPDRDPGPLVQRRRVAVLPRHPGLLRRYRGPVPARDRRLADLEPGVLRQHDHRQRQHLAVPDRRAVPLPVPGPQRLPVPLLDPRLQPASPASRSGRSATRAASSPLPSTSPPTTATGC